MMDIEDKRKPLVGVTLGSSVDLADMAYAAGCTAAKAAVVKLLFDTGEPASLMNAINAIPFEPSPSIEKMKAALE